MESPRSIFSLRFLLISVGFAALLMAANRTRSIAAIMGACTVCLAYIRTSDILASRRAEEIATSRWQRSVIMLTSAAIAVAIVGFADLAFVLGYFGYLRFLAEIHIRSKQTPFADISLMGLAIGFVMALVIASRLKGFLWTIGSTPRRDRPRWSTLWPLASIVAVGLWLGAVLMRERVEFCRKMVAYHAGRERVARRAKSASRHANLKEWYKHTMWRPWLPVAPVTPPAATQTGPPAQATVLPH